MTEDSGTGADGHPVALVEAPAILLSEPADGVPDVITDERALMAAAERIAGGEGPVAVDAERASGYRYGQRAYLVQLRRVGAGSFLFDPIACPDLSPVDEAIGGAEWILHAATQDLVCLAEVGLRPQALFDTELGGRLAGRPRVGLGAMVEHYLGIHLAKEHSAADWSTRPLPEPWLRYAALDVEVLGDLRDAVSEDLATQGKALWAAEEFTSLLDFTGPEPRVDPWRRTSGMHKVRTPRGAAIVRDLWTWRDEVARDRDVSPGRVISDAVIADIAVTNQRADAAPKHLRAPEPRHTKSVRRHEAALLERIQHVMDLPTDDLPPVNLPSSGPPPAKSWADRDPVAAARLARARELLSGLAEELALPVENILTPDLLRRYIWEGPARPTTPEVATALEELGARHWQQVLAAPLIALAAAENPRA